MTHPTDELFVSADSRSHTITRYHGTLDISRPDPDPVRAAEGWCETEYAHCTHQHRSYVEAGGCADKAERIFRRYGTLPNGWSWGVR